MNYRRMNKVIVLLFVFLIYGTNILSQADDYYFFNACGKYFQNHKEYNKGVVEFKKACELKLSAYSYLSLAECQILLMQYKEAEITLYKGIENGLGREVLESLSQYNEFKPHFERVLKNYSKHNKIFFQRKGNIQHELFVNSLFVADQVVREYLDYSDRDSMATLYAQRVDSINIDTFCKYINAYGFPKLQEISSDCHLELLLLHWMRYTSNSLILQLDSTLLKIFKSLGGNPYFYAMGKDQESIIKSNKTIYGVIDVYGRKNEPYEYVDIINVDKLRKSIGLPTLYEDYLCTDKKLPEGYLVPELIKKRCQNELGLK